MRALEKKLLRELVLLRGQVLTIALVVACGVTAYVAMRSTHRALTSSRSVYYAERSFGDLFARLERAPNAVAGDLARIPGVARVATRIVRDVSLDLPAIEEPTRGRLVSVDADGGATLDRYQIRRGRDLDPTHSREVLALEPFAAANHLQPGDTISAVIDGRRQVLRIVGTVLSPEYVHPILGGELFATEARAGVLWMSRPALEAAFDMGGAFDDVALDLAPGASESAVIEATDRILAPYGGTGAFGRSRHPSDYVITSELGQLETQATIEPAIFLLVAAFLVNVVLSRLVQTQREQIASLKALGYSSVEVSLHFAELALAIALSGALVGALAGSWLAVKLTALYARFFHFPLLDAELDLQLALEASAISIAATVLGAIGAVRKVAALPPAEGMRPESPAAYTRTLAERLGLEQLLATPVRMITRNLEHRPLRSFTSVLGVALAMMTLIAGMFWQDSLDGLLDVQFRTAQREDVAVSLLRASSPRAVHALAELPGVRRAEAMRAVPIRLRAGHRVRTTALMAVRPDAELRRVVTKDGDVLALPPEGIALSAALATRLGIGRGSEVVIERLEGDRAKRPTHVTMIVDDAFGALAYADEEVIARLFGERPAVTGAALTIDSAAEHEVLARLKRSPLVWDAARRRAIIDYFQKTNAEMVLVFTAILTLFATVISVGVVYNAARIALAERGRDLATLRVLGFTRGEISRILLGELGFLVAAAIPLGLLLGHRIAALLVGLMMDPDLLRLEAIVSLQTDFYSILVILISGSLSALVVRRGLDRLDLVGVLKSRD